MVMQSDRRGFMMRFGVVSVGIGLLPGTLFTRQRSPEKTPFLTMARNGSPAALVQKALEPLGGIAAFVKKDQIVVVKPNMSWDRRPEQGANTHPEIVATVVKLALEAGAKQVRVFDRTCNEKRRCYRHSGVAEAAKHAGARVDFVNERRFKTIKIPAGKRLTSWQVYQDVLQADVIINVPVLKHHSLTGVSIGMKNLMGFMGGDRGTIHRNFDEKIVDFATIVRPDLTIIDATRVLMRNGPQGGNLADVEQMNIVIASPDMVAADALAASLMDLSGQRLGYLVEAEKRGLGTIDLEKMRIQKIELS